MMCARQALTVKRYGQGSYSEGVYSNGTEETLEILASIQPLTPEEMELLPEARRNSASFNLFTDTQLKAAIEGEPSTNADVVTLPAGEFEVISCARWQNSIINHYKAVVVKL